MKLKNNNWFVALASMLLLAISWIIISVLFTKYTNSLAEHREAYMKMQASNLAIEWIESVRLHIMKELNLDREEWWENWVQYLSGYYIIDKSNGLEIVPWSLEKGAIEWPIMMHYERKIEIVNEGFDSNEKRVKSTVSFWEKSSISYETSFTNKY